MTAPIIDSGNVVSTNNYFATLNCTIAGAVNLLIVAEGSWKNPFQTPSAMTYNGVSMTRLVTVNDGSFTECSIWYLINPPAGTHTVAWTFPSGQPSAVGIFAIPVSGVNTAAPFGTAASASGTSNNNAAVTATGGAATDLYIGADSNLDSSQASGGSQTTISTFDPTGGNASARVDTIVGGGSGAFTFTGNGTSGLSDWSATAVAIKGSVVAADNIGALASPGPAIQGPFNLNQFRAWPYSTYIAPIVAPAPLQVGYVQVNGPGVGPANSRRQFGRLIGPSTDIVTTPAAAGSYLPVYPIGFSFMHPMKPS